MATSKDLRSLWVHRAEGVVDLGTKIVKVVGMDYIDVILIQVSQLLVLLACCWPSKTIALSSWFTGFTEVLGTNNLLFQQSFLVGCQQQIRDVASNVGTRQIPTTFTTFKPMGTMSLRIPLWLQSKQSRTTSSSCAYMAEMVLKDSGFDDRIAMHFHISKTRVEHLKKTSQNPYHWTIIKTYQNISISLPGKSSRNSLQGTKYSLEIRASSKEHCMERTRFTDTLETTIYCQ